MPILRPRNLAALATALVLAGAGASGLPAPSCELPASEGDPLADRAGLLARYEQLPPACLAEIFRACADAADRALLDFGSAASCSLGYEAWLSKGFGGDFGRLMAWWRGERSTRVQ